MREYPLTPKQCYMATPIENVAEFMKGRFTGPADYRIWCHMQGSELLENHLEQLVKFEIYDAAAVARDVLKAKKKSQTKSINETTIYPSGTGKDS